MKKIHLFQIISVTTLILLSSPLAKAVSFNDVSAGHSNADAIEYVKTNEIVSGYPDGTYKPDNTINRAEFTKIIVGAQFDTATIDNCIAENTQEDWSYVFFPDVPKDAWFAKYICVAKMHDIIKGYPDGTFGPAKDINFAEAAKIIVNAFGYTVATDEIWYKPFVEKLGEKKSIPTTITGFSKNITRGEMAEMVYRLKANVTTKASLSYEAIEVAGVKLDHTYSQQFGNLTFSIDYPSKSAKVVEHKDEYKNVINFLDSNDERNGVMGISFDGTWYIDGPIPEAEETIEIAGYEASKSSFSGISYIVIPTKTAIGEDILIWYDSRYDFVDEILDSLKIEPVSDLLTYRNDEYGYSVSYPNDWHYKTTGGTYFSQAVGFNPAGVSDEDYQAIVAVLSVDRQTYLNSLDDNSNLKIVREYGVLIDNQPGVKYTYQNISTDSTFSIYILTFNDTNYLITADESVEDTFMGSFAIQAELEMAFDACGKLTAYQDYAWFNTLNQKYEDEFLVPQDLSGDVGGDFGEGCLALDGSLFIFIPEYFEFGCGKVFSYDVKNDILKTPDQQYCASKFGQRVNNYVLFTGSEGDGGTCKKYDGKYYFLENRVETTTGSC